MGCAKTMIELSLSEIDALVLKAYRGAGFSWGMAQEAGRASGWLALNGLPVASFFDSLLKQIDGVRSVQLTPSVSSGLWHRSENPLCPVVSGTVLSDSGLSYFSVNPIELGVVYSPGLLLPFAAACASAASVHVHLQCNKNRVSITEHGILQSADLQFLAVESASVIISTSSATSEVSTPAHSHAHRRVPVREDVFERLAKLAHRTYVPASEQSRATGAGAGITDND